MKKKESVNQKGAHLKVSSQKSKNKREKKTYGIYGTQSNKRYGHEFQENRKKKGKMYI